MWFLVREATRKEPVAEDPEKESRFTPSFQAPVTSTTFNLRRDGRERELNLRLSCRAYYGLKWNILSSQVGPGFK